MQVWLGKTLQKLDSLLLGVCQEFKKEAYINVSISSSNEDLDHFETNHAWDHQFLASSHATMSSIS